VVAFNFANPGTGPLRTLLLWHRLRRQGLRPDLLVAEVLPALLGDDYDDLTEQITPTCTLCWDELPILQRYAGPGRAGLRREWLWDLALPWHSQRRALVGQTIPALLPLSQRLSAPDFGSPSGDPPRGRDDLTPAERARALAFARREYRDRLAHFRLGQRPWQALHELLASSRAAGVSAVLLLMPEGPTFRSWYPPGQWEAIERRLRALAREHGAALVNARAWVDREGDFLDSHHLHLHGAQRLSARLAREGLLPLLEARTPPARHLAGSSAGP
jgi:hypothetical protein